MGRSVRQKRKGRSSRPVIKQSNSRKRPLNPTGNAIIAQNWNKDETLTQNYRRLGLMNRLKLPSGGVERLGVDAVSERSSANPKASELSRHTDPFKIDSSSYDLSANGTSKSARVGSKTTSAISEVRVERDAEGRIVRVINDAAPIHNPLNDPLNDLEDSEDDEEDNGKVYEEWGGFEDETKPGKKNKAGASLSFAKTPVVEALERMANQPVGPKQPRYQSSAERDWLQNLVDYYGTADPNEDVLARMARDRRRNAFQRTANDLRRRLAVFRSKGGAVSRSRSS